MIPLRLKTPPIESETIMPIFISLVESDLEEEPAPAVGDETRDELDAGGAIGGGGDGKGDGDVTSVVSVVASVVDESCEVFGGPPTTAVLNSRPVAVVDPPGMMVMIRSPVFTLVSTVLDVGTIIFFDGLFGAILSSVVLTSMFVEVGATVAPVTVMTAVVRGRLLFMVVVVGSSTFKILD